LIPQPDTHPGPLASPADACTLRHATPADAGVLCVFAARTFTDTYGRHNDPRNLRHHLEATFGLAQQTAELCDRQVTTLLALVDGQLAGYAQIRRGPAPACVNGPAPIELHRFYVDRDWHGRGISQCLMVGARAAARDFSGDTLWLKVWENNARAIAFYAKSDFVDVGSADFFVGSDRQRDRVLAARLG
jgi:GNAT superfamily N-acetyltransferase